MGFKKADKRLARTKKHLSIRKKCFGTPERPRLVVFRSAKNIYAQLVDDVQHRTLTGVSSLAKGIRDDVAKAKSKKDVAFIVGQSIAKKAKSLKIDSVVFDRSGYLYHGRVKALAEGAREGGLKF